LNHFNVKRSEAGFTLLEVMVATTIMAIAVVTLLGGISASMRNASRLTSYDRAVMRAHSKMDELTVNHRVPANAEMEEMFDSSSGWHAHFSPYETLPGAPQGTPMLERIQLEIWWMESGKRHVFPLEGYRRSMIPLQITPP
jgi:type II secretion system protein I